MLLNNEICRYIKLNIIIFDIKIKLGIIIKSMVILLYLSVKISGGFYGGHKDHASSRHFLFSILVLNLKLCTYLIMTYL